MSLFDEVSAVNGRPGVKGCAVDRFLSEQESWPVPEGKDRRFTRAEWEEVLSNGRLQHKAVLKVMQSYGYEFAQATVSRHRRAECSCPKS